MLQKLTDNVYAETDTPGSNHSLVVTTQGTVTIDSPQMPSYALKWKKETAKFGTARYIINTEPHGDHVGGNYFLEGTIISHEGVRQTMQETPVQMYKDAVNNMESASLALLDNYSYRLPDITYNNKMTLYLGKHTFRLFNLPGHTPFQTAVYVPEEKTLFTSDNVVYKTMPFMFPTSMLGEWFKSLQFMQTLDVEHVVPGHGAVGDKSHLAAMVDELQVWIKTVFVGISKKMSLEETQAITNLIPRYPPSHMTPERTKQVHDMNVATVYNFIKHIPEKPAGY